MFSYFKNPKITYFDVFCLKFSIETKIKTIFQISYFNLSKKTKWHFGYTGYKQRLFGLHDFFAFFRKLTFDKITAAISCT